MLTTWCREEPASQPTPLRAVRAPERRRRMQDASDGQRLCFRGSGALAVPTTPRLQTSAVPVRAHLRADAAKPPVTLHAGAGLIRRAGRTAGTVSHALHEESVAPLTHRLGVDLDRSAVASIVQPCSTTQATIRRPTFRRPHPARMLLSSVSHEPS